MWPLGRIEPVTLRFGPAAAVACYAFVAIVLPVAMAGLALSLREEVPARDSLQSVTGQITGLSVVRGRRESVRYDVELAGGAGETAVYRLEGPVAAAVDRLDLERTARSAPVTLRYADWGLFATQRHVYEIEAGGRRLLAYETAAAGRAADVAAQRRAGPLWIAGLGLALAASVWSFVRYEWPLLRTRTPRPAAARHGHRSRPWISQAAAGVVGGVRERVMFWLRLPLLPVRYLGHIGTGALIVALAGLYLASRWDDRLPPLAALDGTVGTVIEVRRSERQREGIIELRVATTDRGQVRLELRPAQLARFGLVDGRLAGLEGQPIAVHVERVWPGQGLAIYALSVGGRSYLTWEQSQQLRSAAYRNERLVALVLAGLGLGLVVYGLWRRRSGRIAQVT